jgi:hypothetical protein
LKARRDEVQTPLFPADIALAIIASVFVVWFTWQVVEVDTKHRLQKRKEYRDILAEYKKNHHHTEKGG